MRFPSTGDIHDRVKTLRQRLCLSQKDLAEYLGVSQFTLSRWERGEHKPTGRPLEKLLELELNQKDSSETLQELEEKCLEAKLLDHELQELMSHLSEKSRQLILTAILRRR